MSGCCEHGSELLVSIKYEGVLGQLRKYQVRFSSRTLLHQFGWLVAWLVGQYS